MPAHKTDPNFHFKMWDKPVNTYESVMTEHQRRQAEFKPIAQPPETSVPLIWESKLQRPGKRTIWHNGAPMPEQYKAQLEELLRAVPDEVKERFSAITVLQKGSKKHPDIDAWVKYVSTDKFAPVEMYINEKTMNKWGLARTFYHEIGHGIFGFPDEFGRYNGGGILSEADQQKWQHFWEQRNNRLTTDYSQRIVHEGFAEEYAQWMLQKQSGKPVYSWNGKLQDPLVYKFMDNLMLPYTPKYDASMLPGLNQGKSTAAGLPFESKPSKVHGLGVFATEPIAKGTVIKVSDAAFKNGEYASKTGRGFNAGRSKEYPKAPLGNVSSYTVDEGGEYYQHYFIADRNIPVGKEILMHKGSGKPLKLEEFKQYLPKTSTANPKVAEMDLRIQSRAASVQGKDREAFQKALESVLGVEAAKDVQKSIKLAMQSKASAVQTRIPDRAVWISDKQQAIFGKDGGLTFAQKEIKAKSGIGAKLLQHEYALFGMQTSQGLVRTVARQGALIAGAGMQMANMVAFPLILISVLKPLIDDAVKFAMDAEARKRIQAFERERQKAYDLAYAGMTNR